MPPVLIVCPVGDELVPTRVNAQKLDDLDGDNLLINCPECGRDHRWTPLEAVLSVAVGWGTAT
jgi:hypothetical protein